MLLAGQIQEQSSPRPFRNRSKSACIAPSNPPPPSKRSFAALTISSRPGNNLLRCQWHPNRSISLRRLDVRRFTCKGSTGSVALRSFGAVRTSVLLSVRGSTGARFVHRRSPSRLLLTRELLDSPEKAIVISRPDRWFDLKYIPTAPRVSQCSTCLYSSHRERT